MDKQIIHIEGLRGHQKMTPEELQARLVHRRSGHVHSDKKKQIERKRKYKGK